MLLGISGILGGLLCFNGTVPYAKFPIPRFLQMFFATYLKPLLQSANPNSSTNVSRGSLGHTTNDNRQPERMIDRNQPENLVYVREAMIVCLLTIDLFVGQGNLRSRRRRVVIDDPPALPP